MTNDNSKIEIAKLATLSPIEYDQQRKEAAKRLDVRIETLDSEVKSLRVNKEIPIHSKFPPPFNEPEASHEPVNLSELLNELSSTFKRFAILPDHADTALALWVAFTYCVDGVDVAPILAISSPEKQCGKTTVLTLVIKLSAKALPASNISTAALFRAIEAWSPTIIIDEADTFLRENMDLRGILNSGHTRDAAYVIRTTGEEHEPKKFSTWGAKAIALIGKLPETLHDRSIVVELRRKLAHEEADKIRHATDEIFVTLRSKLKRFADDNQDQLRELRPTLPDKISDRSADNWTPLLAIAELAGDEWKVKAFNAAVALSARTNDATSLGTELLADIESIFVTKQCDKISTADLIRALCGDEERPWAGYNRGHQIRPNQMARLLAEYKIYSKTIRISFANTPKGYELKQFEEAFKRYISSENDATPPQARHFKGSSVAVKADDNATVKASNTAPCGVVADYTDEEMEQMFDAKEVYASTSQQLIDDDLPF